MLRRVHFFFFYPHKPSIPLEIQLQTNIQYAYLLQIVTLSGAIGLQSISAGLLGRLHLASSVSTGHTVTGGR